MVFRYFEDSIFLPGWEQEKNLGESAIIRKLLGEVWSFIRTHRYCLLALYFVVYIVTFFIIEEHTPTEGYWVTDTVVDDYIPFVPGFATFYIIWYPLFASVGIPTMLKDEGAFRRWMYYNMFTLSATLILDVLVPNGQHLRPEDVEVTNLGTWIMSIIWAADTPTNDIHQALARGDNRRLRAVHGLHGAGEAARLHRHRRRPHLRRARVFPLLPKTLPGQKQTAPRGLTPRSCFLCWTRRRKDAGPRPRAGFAVEMGLLLGYNIIV